MIPKSGNRFSESDHAQNKEATQAMALTRDYSHYVKDLDPGIAHLDLAVQGVSCAGCMAKIERGLSAIPDVTRARVNLTDGRLEVEWKRGAVDPGLVRQCLGHAARATRFLSLAIGTDRVAGGGLCGSALLSVSLARIEGRWRQHGCADLDRCHPRARHVGRGDYSSRGARLF